MQRYAIHSTRSITPQGLKDATVLIDDGVITEIVPGKSAKFKQLIDIGDDVLMPGIIDPHVHINEPGRTDWEGFDTATKAAMAGGVTTLVDMPLNSSPVTTCKTSFHEKLAAARQHLHTNCGFWGGIIPGNTDDIEPLIEAGVLGFKAFLIDSGIEEYPAATEADLRKAMPIIAKHGLPLLVHCELDGRMQKNLTQRSQSSQRKNEHNESQVDWNNTQSYQVYLVSRPRHWENDAIALMIRLCEEFNCRTHIVHLSSSDALAQIAEAKRKGLPLTVETGQHYLFFAAEEIGDGQTQFKCAPPIREKSNNEILWRALKEGLIDFVATDHSPCPPEMKELESGDFIKAWGGISSIQFALPVLWTAAKEHQCDPVAIAKWLCEKPAAFIGTEKKGKIEKGCDADFVIWSPEEQFTIKEEMILHRHKVTPYLNRSLYGVVKQTYLAGELVYDKGEFLHLNKGESITNGTITNYE